YDGRTKCSTQPPTRTDEQIVPLSQWLIIGKSNILFNAQKIQKNPIFQISVDILSNTNFSYFMPQKKALAITPEIVFNYPGELLYQPWRAILTLINQWLTGKTSGSDKPRHPHYNISSTYMDSVFHHTGDDFILGNLKFVPKGETVEVFGMAIPDPLINEAIQQSSYYPKLSLERLLRYKKTLHEVQYLTTDNKQSVPQEEGDDHDLELAKNMSLDSHQEKGEGEGADADMERAIKLSLDPAFMPQGRAPVGGVMIRDPKKRTTDQFIIVRRDQALHDSITGPSSQPEDDTSEKVSRFVTSNIRSKIPVSDLKMLYRESIKNQESEKSPKEIIRIRKEQGEQKQESTYSIRSTDKVALEEFDLKSALFKHMNKNKTANRNPANYHLYHALMEALIADEDAMDKEVAVKVKDHKRKHDSDDDEDDDDNEGPSAGSNQGKSAKRRRHDSGASGSAQPPIKDDEQSSKKPLESDASASKQHPDLTSTGWQITDTRDDVVESSMHISDPESKHSEQSSDDIPMQDEGHVSDWRTQINATFPRTSVGPMASLNGGLEEKEFTSTNIVKPSDRENSQSQMRNSQCDSVKLGIESYQTKINLERLNWDAADYYFKEDYTIVPKPRVIVYRDRNDQRKLMRLNELHKFSDGTLTRVMEKLDHMVKDFHLFEYNKGMETRKWSEDDKRISKDVITAIEKRL
ncbi:hypothetical protein Tco_0979782, partial [Tanacetum coccineum]